MSPGSPRRQEPPAYFEQALTDAMHTATHDLEPITPLTAGLRRQAALWRAALALAVAVAVAAVVVAVGAVLRPAHVEEAAAQGVPRAAPTVGATPTAAAGRPAASADATTATPTSPGTTGVAESSTGGPSSETTGSPGTGPRSGSGVSSSPAGAAGDGGSDTEGGRGDAGPAGDPPDPGPRAAPAGCSPVPDGSEPVRRLVLDTAHELLRPVWDDLPGPPIPLDDVPDVVIENRLGLDEVVASVAAYDIVDCGGGLRFADPADGDLDAVVEREVAAAIAAVPGR